MGAGKHPFSDYPKHVFLILGNEFCERFSFYGMKAILVLFLTRALNFSDNDATALYHGFNMACYFMPIFGAIIADGLLGKFKTIFIISIVYGIGNVVMAVGAIPMNAGSYISAIPFIGLILIAVGTGGIKPCVSAFGADQFKQHQIRQKETFFSMFYMSINLGSLLSMIITPSLRSSVECFGDNCYALAFGIPAILMIVAVVFFMAGSSLYTKHPAGDNIIGNLLGCVWTALKGTCRCKGDREHWLDHADSKYPKEFITDVKGVMRVLFMFLPLPIFWALFDQQGSRWTLQAGQMNGDFGGFVLQPDLIQVVNPLLVVLMVPFLESVIFPCLHRLRIPNRPLQRLGLGMFLAGTAFIVAALVQVSIDNSLPTKISSENVRINILNASPCKINLTMAASPQDDLVISPQVDPTKKWTSDDFTANGNRSIHMSFLECVSDAGKPQDIKLKKDLLGGQIYNFIATIDNKDDGKLHMVEQMETMRTGKGEATVRFMNALEHQLETEIEEVKVVVEPEQVSEAARVKHASIEFSFKSNGTGDGPTFKIPAKAGAVYYAVLHKTNDLTSNTSTVFEVINANNVNILWMIPQYFVMSMGECFFSVTGLSFAYAEAPPSMKAVLQAAWLLTNSLGNLIVMVISAIGQLPNQTMEYILFAGLMYLTVIIFAIMSITFKYKEPTSSADAENDDKNEPTNDGYDNYAIDQNDEHPPSYEAVAETVSSTYM